ncbi:MAG: NUDIX hydrolase [Chloroflexi bacterium]|nr:NUDIX hydrolase [Chloroflexota bacterium]
MDEKHLIEETVSTETVFEGRVFDLQVKSVRLPDGSASKRDIIQHPGAVAVVPLFNNERVILVRQFRSALETIMWEIPAGTLEPGEEPLAAAERELREEIGYHPNNLIPLGGIHVAPGYSSEYIHIYLSTELSAVASGGDVDEFIEKHDMPLSEAFTLLRTGQITDAKTIAGLLLTQQYLDNQT